MDVTDSPLAPVADAEPDFITRVQRENEPILSHAITIVLLLSTFLLAGLATIALERMLPEHRHEIALIKWIDVVSVIALLCLYVPYTLAIAGIRLWRGITTEISKAKR